MVITIKKLRGRPRKDARFALSYGEWLSLGRFGVVKIGGYLLTTKRKKNG